MNTNLRPLQFATGMVCVALILLTCLGLIVSASAAHAADSNVRLTVRHSTIVEESAVTVPVTWTQRNTDGFGVRDVKGVMSFAVFGDQLYAGTSAWDGTGARRLFRSKDGLVWDEVIGIDFERPYNYAIQSLVVYSSNLYAGTTNFNWIDGHSEGAEIWRSPNGLEWTAVVSGGMGDSQQAEISTFAEFNGYLYAGTFNITKTLGAEIWRSRNGSEWDKVITGGLASDDSSAVRALYAYTNALFAGVSNYATGAEVWRSDDGLAWTRILTGGFDNSARPSVTSFVAYDSHLYTYLTGEGGVVLLRCQMCDGSDWSPVAEPGFGNPSNTFVGSFAVTGDALNTVVGNGDSGIEVWRSHNGEDWSLTSQGGFGDEYNSYTGGQGGAIVFADRLFVGSTNENTGGEIWSYFVGPTFLVEVLRNANLRGGPGTNHAVVGGVESGQILAVVGQNESGSWYQLGNDKWIAASLIERIERGPDVEGSGVSTVTATLSASAPPLPAPKVPEDFPSATLSTSPTLTSSTPAGSQSTNLTTRDELTFRLLGIPGSYNPDNRHWTIADLQAWHGRIYIGHGDWIKNTGPVHALYWDPINGSFVHDDLFSFDEESVDIFRVIDDVLYVPGTDPKESWEYGNLYTKPWGGLWTKHRTIPGAVHLFDVQEFEDLLIVNGSLANGAGAFWHSSDRGQTWTTFPEIQAFLPPHAGDSAFPAHANLFVVDGHIWAGLNSRGCLTLDANIWHKAKCLPTIYATGPLKTALLKDVIVMTPYWNPALVQYGRSLFLFNGADHWSVSFGEAEIPTDLRVVDEDLYVLTTDRQSKGRIYHATELTCRCIEDFHLIGEFDLVEGQTTHPYGNWPVSLEYDDGYFYVGTADGRLFQAQRRFP